MTTLLIPGLNDAPDEVQELAEWLGSISPDIPLHFSRYFPQYQLDLPPTPVERLSESRELAARSLHYVYLGNLADEDRNTYCPVCRFPVVRRDRSSVKIDLQAGACPECGAVIPIIV